MWINMYNQTEANWKDSIEEMMEKEAFSEGMGDTLNYYLQYQELMNKMTESYLKSVNLPTRSEISDVASLVVNLEEKVDHIDYELDDKLEKLSSTKDIGQLKRSITNLDKKLDTVIKEINSLPKDKETKEKK